MKQDIIDWNNENERSNSSCNSAPPLAVIDKVLDLAVQFNELPIDEYMKHKDNLEQWIYDNWNRQI